MKPPCGVCGTHPARRYMNAWLCPAHEPHQVPVDPSRTAAALRARRSLAIRAAAKAVR